MSGLEDFSGIPEKSSDNQYMAMCVCQLIEGGEMVLVVLLCTYKFALQLS